MYQLSQLFPSNGFKKSVWRQTANDLVTPGTNATLSCAHGTQI